MYIEETSGYSFIVLLSEAAPMAHEPLVQKHLELNKINPVTSFKVTAF